MIKRASKYVKNPQSTNTPILTDADGFMLQFSSLGYLAMTGAWQKVTPAKNPATFKILKYDQNTCHCEQTRCIKAAFSDKLCKLLYFKTK
jgi:hypothetical protein